MLLACVRVGTYMPCMHIDVINWFSPSTMSSGDPTQVARLTASTLTTEPSHRAFWVWLYRCGSWHTEKVSSWPKVTQFTSREIVFTGTVFKLHLWSPLWKETKPYSTNKGRHKGKHNEISPWMRIKEKAFEEKGTRWAEVVGWLRDRQAAKLDERCPRTGTEGDSAARSLWTCR